MAQTSRCLRDTSSTHYHWAYPTDVFTEHVNQITLRLIAKHCRHQLQRLRITNKLILLRPGS